LNEKPVVTLMAPSCWNSSKLHLI